MIIDITFNNDKTIRTSNLNNAMKEFLDREIISLVNQGNLVHPQMLVARNKFNWK